MKHHARDFDPLPGAEQCQASGQPSAGGIPGKDKSPWFLRCERGQNSQPVIQCSWKRVFGGEPISWATDANLAATRQCCRVSGDHFRLALPKPATVEVNNSRTRGPIRTEPNSAQASDFLRMVVQVNRAECLGKACTLPQ